MLEGNLRNYFKDTNIPFIRSQHRELAEDLMPLINSTVPKDVIFGLNLLALRMIKSNNLWKESLIYLKHAFYLSGYSSKEIIQSIAHTCNYLKDYPTMADAAYLFALNAIKEGNNEAALEAMGFAWFAYSYKRVEEPTILSVPDTIIFYNKIAAAMGQRVDLTKRPKNKKTRIGHVVFRIVDEAHSPTKMLVSFINHHATRDFDIYVYNSEDIAIRLNPKFYLASPLPLSEKFAHKTLNLLKERGISCYVPSMTGSCLDTAKDLVKKIREDNIDVLMFHSSIMCNIACVASLLRPAPVQINMNIGASMYVDSLDCVAFFSNSVMLNELPYWDKLGVASRFMPSGTDVSLEMTDQPPQRSEFGIPKDVVLLATSGHLLPQRMGENFIDVLIAILKENPKVHYAIIGAGDFNRLNNRLAKEELIERVHFIGFRKDAANLMKIIDIYINQFPEGGGLSVLEAMAACKPAVAMKYDDTVTGSGGAVHVGQEYTIKSQDYASYIDFANKLIRDEKFRADVGVKMRKRYEEVFSPQVMVKAFEELAVELYQKKTEGRP